ncbi:MAG: DNA-directed RNA polymerase subunit alpha [Candidatus Eremiobacteraeota bacterium]|nr:DNA-directed RNA polymerase subunit alpha [Candidatus Eremiobacteraeota bacterium]
MLDVIEKPKIKSDSEENYGKFVIEPLERGFGITLGNSLRRILLSSITGAAVTHIRIEGILHEFSTIPGVIEDVTEIVLNVKKLNFKLLTEKPKTVKIEVKGEGRVTASDIQPDPEVEVLNPDCHVATLTEKNARLSMEMRVGKGKGYVAAEKQKAPEQILGLIPVDSIFSPIRKVKYTVEDTRVGQVTNYDRLILEVWTDGSVQPHDAVSSAAELLQRYLSFFTNLKPPSAVPVASGSVDQAQILDMPIEELGLSVRSLNCLKRAAVRKVGDLVALSEDDVMKLKNFGQKSLVEIKEKLTQYELSLAPPSREEV